MALLGLSSVIILGFKETCVLLTGRSLFKRFCSVNMRKWTEYPSQKGYESPIFPTWIHFRNQKTWEYADKCKCLRTRFLSYFGFSQNLQVQFLCGIIFDDTLIFMIRIVIHTKFFEGRYKCELPMASVSFSVFRLGISCLYLFHRSSQRSLDSSNKN